MKVAFTGTQRGMTILQANRLWKVFELLPRLKEFHHGSCIGADEGAHVLLLNFDAAVNRPDTDLHLHPTTIPGKRAYLPEGCVWPPDPDPIHRDHVMVNQTEALIAAPGEMDERLRSGTWATIRYARKMNRRIYIVWPDGTMTIEPARGLTAPSP